MKYVHELLRQKPLGIVAVPPDASVLEAIQLLAEKEIGAVLVMEGVKLVGILSERDYARKVALRGKSSVDTPVSDIMTRKVLCVTPSDTRERCMQIMTEKRVRHLPVLADKQVIGLLSIGDLVKDIMSEQQFTIKQLESYIHQ